MTSPSPGVPIRFGAQLWSQASTWPEFRAAALAAEAGGWDSVWTWDHLLAIFGPWRQPIFEGWTSLAAFAALTSRVRLGLMVGANTFRNPGLTAKLATTLDHISDGRAVLGIGGAWFNREHEAHGIDFRSGFGERLDALDESVGVIRRLLDGETLDHRGTYYALTDAVHAPAPIQAHLPILIGGSGPKKTLRTTAKYGDGWNTAGEVDECQARLDVLREHCAAVNRDPAEIELTCSFPIVIRTTLPAAERAYAALMVHNGIERMDGPPVLLGEPERVADRLRPYLALGFRTFIVRLPAPYDHETLARMSDVAALLEV